MAPNDQANEPTFCMMAPWIQTFAEARWTSIVATRTKPMKGNSYEPPDGLVLRCFSGIDESSFEITGDFLGGWLYYNEQWKALHLHDEKPVYGLIDSRMLNHEMNVSSVGSGGHWIVEEMQWYGLYTRRAFAVENHENQRRAFEIYETYPVPVRPNYYRSYFPSKWSGK